MTFTVTAPPECVCGHGDAMHDLNRQGVRTVCSVMDRNGCCACRRYVPALSEVEA